MPLGSDDCLSAAVLQQHHVTGYDGSLSEFYSAGRGIYVLHLRQYRTSFVQCCPKGKRISGIRLLSKYSVPQKEFFTFKTGDGVSLNGWMMKPVNFSASKKYPVLLYQYSGPGSQQVLDTWSISWETYMASRGFIVVCVDGRGTGGRGADFEKCTYLNLGVKEAKRLSRFKWTRCRFQSLG